MTAPLPLRVLNALSAALPLWTWKPALLLRVREWVAKWLLAMGDLRFSFVTPSGHNNVGLGKCHGASQRSYREHN